MLRITTSALLKNGTPDEFLKDVLSARLTFTASII
jgi:hypothetical protein